MWRIDGISPFESWLNAPLKVLNTLSALDSVYEMYRPRPGEDGKPKEFDLSALTSQQKRLHMWIENG